MIFLKFFEKFVLTLNQNFANFRSKDHSISIIYKIVSYNENSLVILYALSTEKKCNKNPVHMHFTCHTTCQCNKLVLR